MSQSVILPSEPPAAIILDFQNETIPSENAISIKLVLCSDRTANGRKLFHENTRMRPSKPPVTKTFKSFRILTQLTPEFFIGISAFLSIVALFVLIVNISILSEVLPIIPRLVTRS